MHQLNIYVQYGVTAIDNHCQHQNDMNIKNRESQAGVHNPD